MPPDHTGVVQWLEPRLAGPYQDGGWAGYRGNAGGQEPRLMQPEHTVYLPGKGETFGPLGCREARTRPSNKSEKLWGPPRVSKHKDVIENYRIWGSDLSNTQAIEHSCEKDIFIHSGLNVIVYCIVWIIVSWVSRVFIWPQETVTSPECSSYFVENGQESNLRVVDFEEYF